MDQLLTVVPEFVCIRKARVRHSIEEMRHITELRNGACLSATFLTLRHELEWQCHRAHTWWAIAGNVLRGSWCPYCARRLRGSIDEMKQIALSRGGQCLSVLYENRRTLLEWRCSAGHTWSAPAAAILAGKWCLHCSLVEKYTIEDLRQLARERGGKCNSSYYANLQQRIAWECAKGHTWRASTASILRETWCPVCAKNQRLEIAEMRRIAESHGGLCLSSTHLNNHTPLLWACREGHRWLAAPSNVRRTGNKRGTWCPVCASQARKFQDRLTLEDARATAIERGGQCVSEQYRGSKFKLTWQCALGHQWQAKITPVRRGSWCPECAGNRKLEIALFHRLAANKGGLCLSDEYTNKNTALAFECSVGHRWNAPERDIKRGSWCSICARTNRKRRYSPARTNLLIGTDFPGPSTCPVSLSSTGTIHAAQSTGLKGGNGCGAKGVYLRQR